jgi:parvulin-like peptidyl-prolyl isomerase
MYAVVVAVGGLAAGEPEEVVARVGDRVITQQDLDDAVYSKTNRSYFHGKIPEDTLVSMRRDVLAEIVRQNLDLLGALDLGMKPDLSEARRRCEAMERELGGEKYEEGIAARGWTREGHALVLAETMLSQEARGLVEKGAASVDESDLRALYNGAKDRWRVPESIHLWHIVLEVSSDAEESIWVSREDECRALMRRLNKGERFEDLARAHSEDDFRVKGGDLGWVHRGQLVPSLESLAWSLELGEIGGPVRSAKGVHILHVSERKIEHQMSFEEAEPILRREVAATRSEEAARRWYEGIIRRHPVTILDPQLEGVLD